MAIPILLNELRPRLSAIHQNLAKLEITSKSLLVLREFVLVRAALQDGLQASDEIYAAAMELTSLFDRELRELERKERPC